MLKVRSKRIIAIFLAAGIIYNTASDALAKNVVPTITSILEIDPQDKMIEEVEDYFGEETEEEKNNRNLQKLLVAIINNEHLSKKEKEVIYSLKDLMSENEYLNTLIAKAALSTVKVEYDCPLRSGLEENVLAAYFDIPHKIEVYGPKNYTRDEVLTHEFIHCIYTRTPLASTPSYFIEGMTELLNNEYISNDPYAEVNSYPFEIASVKILCELIGSDNVLKAYSKGNISIIKDNLERIGGTERTEKFLTNLNSIFESYEANKDINEEELKQVITYLDSYFIYLKDNENGLDQYNNYLYYRGIIQCMTSEEPISDYLIYLAENGILNKPYFSEKLKEEETSIPKVYSK